MITFEIVTATNALEKVGQIYSFPLDSVLFVGNEQTASGKNGRRNAIPSSSGVNLNLSFDKEVSKKHCKLTVGSGPDENSSSKRKRAAPISATLEDLKSTNGSYVNGKLVTRKTQIFVGNKIRFGSTVLAVGKAQA